MALVVLDRASSMVVSGQVVNITDDTVTLRGAVSLPVTGGAEERLLHMRVPKGKMVKKWLKRGSSVMAITSLHPSLSETLHGGETTEKEYTVTAYAIRYTGAFDFPEKGALKEMHVFCGNVLDQSGEHLRLTYRDNGQEVQKALFAPRLSKDLAGRRHIFVTGARTERGQYPVLAAY